MDIQKNFSERYGIDMKEIFEEYYKSEETVPEAEGTPATDATPEADTEEDLLA